MFEPTFAAGHKVSFERDGLDASKARHISAGGNVSSRVAGKGRVIQRFVAKRRTQLLILRAPRHGVVCANWLV
jgi:hypothetical protein